MEMEEEENDYNQFYEELMIAKNPDPKEYKQAARPSLYNVIKNLREDTVSCKYN